MLNQMVSELGEVGVSSIAPLFNVGMIIGGLIFIPFVIGLGLYFNHKLSIWSIIAGLVATISCSLIGFFPMNYGTSHSIVALIFLLGDLFSMTIINLVIVLDKQGKIPKKFVILGFFIALSFIISLFNFILFEWILFFSLNGYLFVISAYLTYRYQIKHRIQ